MHFDEASYICRELETMFPHLEILAIEWTRDLIHRQANHDRRRDDLILKRMKLRLLLDARRKREEGHANWIEKTILGLKDNSQRKFRIVYLLMSTAPGVVTNLDTRGGSGTVQSHNTTCPYFRVANR